MFGKSLRGSDRWEDASLCVRCVELVTGVCLLMAVLEAVVTRSRVCESGIG